jgi:hypothetical protein
MVRANRHLLIDRAKRLERYDLATEIEPGCWIISERAEPILKALSERNDIIKTMDHASGARRPRAGRRTRARAICHPRPEDCRADSRLVLAKGPAGDELGDRLHLVIDGVDGRTHYIETAGASRLDEIRRGHIVSLDPAPTRPSRHRTSTSRRWRTRMAAFIGRASIWKQHGTSSSSATAIRTPSSALISGGWKLCAGPAM